MTIAILATIALVLFVYFLSCILEKELDLYFLSNKNRLKDCIIEEEKAKVEYLQQTIDWVIEKQNVYGKETIADSLMDALRGTKYTTWKYSKKS